MGVQSSGLGCLLLLGHLRAYTRLFGENLLKAYERWCTLPTADRGDLRGRKEINYYKSSDKELFASLPTGDLWLDSRVHEVYLYLAGCKYVELLDCNYTGCSN